jgi:hypothetical protein
MVAAADIGKLVDDVRSVVSTNDARLCFLLAQWAETS